MNTKTPDGLAVHRLDGVGLVVAAYDHNSAISKIESEKARLREALKRILFICTRGKNER